ncbi:energy-coupled thiamine transporter ThiT [Streptococcus macacae]|uniref:Proton-coupled thiamine transporter YuaJ n=1 Tax=Streptococcus macacae NCTC 11558 TaxID=764298 RepID=G5JYP0_9STRE|nr:energy-coupled thiamine transporter ThiT [Streptococcus macacae]EHJ53217.1 putative proton-coupled thiamine transporter YuaJ [Streptococcus macacae NCTC 11558]
MSKKYGVLTEVAITAALSMTLSLVPDFFSWFTPSLGALPLIIFALRRGMKYGLLAGLIWGLLHFLMAKVYYLTFSQVFIEYILAFSSMGLAGLSHRSIQKALRQNQRFTAVIWAIGGAFTATAVRYFFHYLAGFIFWGSYAPKGISPYWYSFTVNASAGLATFLLVAIVLVFLIPSQAHFFLLDKKAAS